jgi:drug/metabolite transporter (DMT)-like permease
VAILSGAIAPSLIFQALALTQVNNVILVGRLEPPLTLALSVWFLREQVNGWQVGGAMAALIGVALTIMLQPAQTPMVVMGNRGLGSGELLATIGAIALAISTIIGKRHLSTVPIGIYSIVRTGLGTVIFFVLASVLYGWEHFMDARSPFLWQWMLIYGVIIVALGQSFWITGLRASSVSTASIIGSFTPIAGILAAYLILGEPPTSAQYIGGSMILAGICLSQIGNRLQPTPRLPPVRSNSMPVEQAIDVKMGFKGI